MNKKETTPQDSNRMETYHAHALSSVSPSFLSNKTNWFETFSLIQPHLELTPPPPPPSNWNESFRNQLEAT